MSDEVSLHPVETIETLLRTWIESPINDPVAVNAFNRLYNLLFPRLFKLFWRGIGESAQDVALEAMLSLWQKHDHLRTSDNFYGYAMQIAYSRYYDHLRRSGREPEMDSFDDPDRSHQLAEAVAETPDVVDDMVGAERGEIVRACLDRLPKEQRQVLELEFWLEMSGAEIAVALDISPRTAASRRRVARVRLAELLNQHGKKHGIQGDLQIREYTDKGGGKGKKVQARGEGAGI